VPGSALHAQTADQTNIIETNIVIVSDGSNVTNTSPGYTGEASAVRGLVQFGIVSVASTSLLSPTGGAQEASDREQSLANGLQVGVSHATVIAQGGVTSSEASVADVSFTSCSGFWGAGVTSIAADFVMSETTTACTTNGATFSGKSQVNGLVVDGQPVAVSGHANQVVFLSGGGFMVINEQVTAETSTTVDGLTISAEGTAVDALHVIVPCAGADLVFGSSAAGIACGNETNAIDTTQFCGDFVTGCGWITTPTGTNANFGVAGGTKDGAFWGHLNCIDHGNGMHVKDTSVTGYAIDEDCRTIDYNVTIDGQPGSARVRVCDKGEPGSNDIFEIQLSNGHFTNSDLGGSLPGGGNIQLHECHE